MNNEDCYVMCNDIRSPGSFAILFSSPFCGFFLPPCHSPLHPNSTFLSSFDKLTQIHTHTPCHFHPYHHTVPTHNQFSGIHETYFGLSFSWVEERTSKITTKQLVYMPQCIIHKLNIYRSQAVAVATIMDTINKQCSIIKLKRRP